MIEAVIGLMPEYCSQLQITSVYMFLATQETHSFGLGNLSLFVYIPNIAIVNCLLLVYSVVLAEKPDYFTTI